MSSDIYGAGGTVYMGNISSFVVDPSNPASTYGLSNTEEIEYETYYNNFRGAFVANWSDKIADNYVADGLGLVGLRKNLDETDDNDEDKKHAMETLMTINKII